MIDAACRTTTTTTILIVVCFASVALSLPQHQQQIDPAYLQQYYAQVAQAAGAQSADATPIVEQTPAADAQQQYYVAPQAQQIRVKDAVAQQVCIPPHMTKRMLPITRVPIVMYFVCVRTRFGPNSNSSTLLHPCASTCSSRRRNHNNTNK